jgi:hypothetical protein
MMQLGGALASWVLGPWSNWPARAYRRNNYQQRLTAVQSHLAECLSESAAGEVRIVSVCAGDGRDVIGVLPSHERREDAKAWLVELDRKSVEAGRRAVLAAGLATHVQFVHGDATDHAAYANLLPCSIVLLCGVLGHVRPDERAETIKRVAQFCEPKGSIIWTRGFRGCESRVREIETLFDEADCERVRRSVTQDQKWAVVTNRYLGPRYEAPTSGRIFTFERLAGRFVAAVLAMLSGGVC